MTFLTEDEVERLIKVARADETERCALLAEQYASFHKLAAARHRVPKRGLFFKYVSEFEEQVARLHDAVEFGATNLARYIRAGYDPRKVDLDPNEQLKTGATGEWQPCVACTDLQHCGSWACCDHPEAPRLNARGRASEPPA